MAIPIASHAPPDYDCPFCAAAAGSQSEFTAWRDEHVLVRISLHWDPDFPGHALVIPVAHVENIYTLPDELAGRIARVVRRVAVAMRHGYPCDGVTIRQNNEPAGGQDVWHLHTHVVPCHRGRKWRGSRFRRADDAERRRYAERLRESLRTIDQLPDRW